MQYRREIDGLRAVAVLPVILFHAGFSVFSGGYVGVDVFFVISGYLITSILISELEQGNFSILRFYERRARRILPALFVVMLACLPFAYMWMLPSQLEDFAQSLVAVVFFGSNILFWRESGYFGDDAELKPLLHTWSLAVEEQYYLIFPIFLLLAWRFGRNRVFWSVVAIAAFSLLLSEWGWRNKPEANFYLAPTRAWELLAGSMCAFLTVGQRQRSSNFLSALGLALIVSAIFYYDENTPFPSAYALAPVVGTALIILFADKATWTARLLSTRGFVGVGLVSYSAYLWHQPLFAFARIRSLTEPSHYLMAALAVAALLLAWVTWRWVEQPFRNRANPILVTRRSVFAASSAVAAVFVVIGLAGHFGDGFKGRYDYRLIEAFEESREGSAVFINESRFDNGECIFSVSVLTKEVIARILNCRNLYDSGTLVIGDSHATNLFHSIIKSEYVVQPPFLVGITSNGCHLPEILDRCPYGDVLSFIENNRLAFHNVIYEKAGYLMLNDREGGDVKRAIKNDADIVIDSEKIFGVAEWLSKLSKFVNVIWYGPRLSPLFSETDLLRRGCLGDFSISQAHIGVYDELDRYIESQVSEFDELLYVSQIQALDFYYPSDYGNCDDGLYWMDQNHFSPKGEIWFGARFDILEMQNILVAQ